MGLCWLGWHGASDRGIWMSAAPPAPGAGRARLRASAPAHLELMRSALAREESAPEEARKVLIRVAGAVGAAARGAGLPELESLASALAQAPSHALGEPARALESALRGLVEEGEGGGPSVLVVEDDPISALIIGNALAQEGRTLLFAKDGSEAREVTTSREVDAIILDLVLPDADGRVLLAEFRGQRATREVPIIVLFGEGGAGPKTECFAYGADLLLEKPVEPAVLSAALSSLLARAARTREGRGERRARPQLLTRWELQEAFARIRERGDGAGAQPTLALLEVVTPDLAGSRSGDLGEGGEAAGAELAARVESLLAALGEGTEPDEAVGRWTADQILLLSNVRSAEALRRLVARLHEVLPEGGDWLRGTVRTALQGEDFVDAAAALAVAPRPMARSPALWEVEEAPGAGPAAQVKGPPSVVLAEDDPISSALVLHRLVRSGLQVTHYENGARALEAIRASPPTVAVLDIKMPGMDGFEVLARMKEDPRTRAVRTLIFTGMGRDSDLDRAFALGADDYLTKPFSPGELLARVLRLARSG